MVDHLQRSEMFRKQLKEQERISTDPAWVRAQMDEHQFSPLFVAIAAIVGGLACTSVIVILGGLYP